jgi:hypothetical protein
VAKCNDEETAECIKSFLRNYCPDGEGLAPQYDAFIVPDETPADQHTADAGVDGMDMTKKEREEGERNARDV